MNRILISAVLLAASVFASAQTKSTALTGEELLPAVYAKVDSVRAGRNLLTFTFITDTHTGAVVDIDRNSRENIDLFVKAANEVADFAGFGGDLFTAYQCPHDSAVVFLSRAAGLYSRLQVPFLAARGNHDANAKVDPSQVVKQYEYYSLFSALRKDVVEDGQTPDCNYFYKDFDEHKVRVVVLNEYDSGKDEKEYFSDRQLEWLRTSALSFDGKDQPSQWSVIFISHFVPKSASHPFNKLVKEFQERGTVIAAISGHFHEDRFTDANGYNAITVTTGIATAKQVGTPDAIAFDVFVLDPASRTLNEFRVGRGSDRTYTY